MAVWVSKVVKYFVLDPCNIYTMTRYTGQYRIILAEYYICCGDSVPT